jgi:integral membrane protein (TIGR01906 family)
MKTGFLNSIGTLAFILLIVALPVLIVSTTATVYSHYVELYKAGFNKYQISKVTGISGTQLAEVARKMVDYFEGRSPTPQLTVISHGRQMQLYSEKELVHLEDVRTIVRLFVVLQIISIIAFILLAIFIYWRTGARELLKGIQTGAIATAVFTGVLIAWALIDFNSLFLLFHFISFSNDLWILDPSRDYLIMMFPEGFFNDSAILIVCTILAEAVIIWLLAFLIRWAYGKRLGSPAE